MLKKSFVFLIGATAALMTATSMANFNGFYAGAAGGLAMGTSHAQALSSATYVTTFGINTTTNPTNAKAYKLGAIGKIDAGYGRIFSHRFYLAGEASLGLANNKVSHTDNEMTTDPFDDSYAVTLNNRVDAKLNSIEFDADLKPGVLITPQTLFYGRIGAALNKVRMNAATTFTYRNTNTGFTTSAIAAASAHKSVAGIRLGVGMEALITKHLALDMNYVYTYYGKVSAAANTTITTDMGGPTTMSQNSSIKVHRQTATLGINYFFD